MKSCFGENSKGGHGYSSSPGRPSGEETSQRTLCSLLGQMPPNSRLHFLIIFPGLCCFQLASKHFCVNMLGMAQRAVPVWRICFLCRTWLLFSHFLNLFLGYFWLFLIYKACFLNFFDLSPSQHPRSALIFFPLSFFLPVAKTDNST